MGRRVSQREREKERERNIDKYGYIYRYRIRQIDKEGEKKSVPPIFQFV